MKKTLIVLGILGMFLFTSLTSVANAQSYFYRGIVFNLQLYLDNPDYQATAFSLIGTIKDEGGNETSYNLKKVKLNEFGFLPTPRVYLLLLLNVTHIFLPLYAVGEVVE